MPEIKRCPSCNVEVSSDLNNCPLCGKFVGDESRQAEKNKYSYPDYAYKEIIKKKTWISIMRVICTLASLLCLAQNLIFKTSPYWFPYALAAIFVFYVVFISPFNSNTNRYIKNIKWTSIVVSIFLIFIDAYNHYMLGFAFGWAYAIAVPCMLSCVTIATAIVCFCSKRNEMELLGDCFAMMLYSIIYFIVKICYFPKLATWPSLTFLGVAIGWFAILEVFKRKRFWKETIKKYHI